MNDTIHLKNHITFSNIISIRLYQFNHNTKTKKMETTKTNNEAPNEGAKVIEKLFNDNTTAMMDIYKKQMDSSVSLYNNLFNSSMSNSNGFDQNSGIPNMFADMDMTKWFTNPFSNLSENNLQNQLLKSIDKTMKQVMELNQKFLSSFTNGIQSKGTNSESMSEEYKKLLEDRLKDSKEMLNTITEAFNKQLESSLENNKKTMEEITNQFSLTMTQNQKLWADMLNTHQTSLVSDEVKEKVVSSNKSKIHSDGRATVKN